MAPSIHHRACNLCEAICGLVVEHEDGRVLSIEGDREDPFSRGHICPKALGLKDIHEDPNRLKKPLRRRGTDFEEISWEEALGEAASRLRSVRSRYGKDAVALYSGNPVVHNYGSTLYGGIVLPLVLGTKNRFSSMSMDHLPRVFVSRELYGSQALLPVPDLDRTKLFFVLGANPVVSNGSIMTAPDVKKRIQAIRARGGRVIVIDPRRTETADIADEHHFVRPGADALLLAAMLRTIMDLDLTRLGRLHPFVTGLGELTRAVMPFTPERVAGAVGIDAETITRLARELASAESAVVYGRMGLSTQGKGALATYLTDALNIVTGNLDREGGSMFGTPAVDLVSLARWAGQQGSFGTFRSRVSGLPEFAGELPVAAFAEEMETPGPGQIKALITSSSNPVLSAAGGARIDAALAKLETMISIDIYLNETTRHAHLILPPTFALEHDHYDVALLALGVRNTVRYSLPLFEPGPDQRHDWEIYGELCARLFVDEAAPAFVRDLVCRAGKVVSPARFVDTLLRVGPHGDRFGLRRGLSLAKLAEAPHGLDLGPLEPRFPALIEHADHKIHLDSPPLLADFSRLERSLAEAASPSLKLIGRRDLRSNNSWMHNSKRLVKGRDRCTLLMHPLDARARGLADGASVRLASRTGAIVAPLEVSDEVMPGVVSLPHGWGHDRDGVRLDVARAFAGVSVNDVTDEARFDPVCGTADINGVPVEVTLAVLDFKEPRSGTPEDQSSVNAPTLT